MFHFEELVKQGGTCMQIIKLNQLETFISPHGIHARKVYNSNDVNVMNLLLQPGEVNPPHASDIDMLFYVIRGKGKISVGAEEAVVAAGEIVVNPKGLAHGLYASEGEHFEVLVVKTPSPFR